jgi:hypothetical protein
MGALKNMILSRNFWVGLPEEYGNLPNMSAIQAIVDEIVALLPPSKAIGETNQMVGIQQNQQLPDPQQGLLPEKSQQNQQQKNSFIQQTVNPNQLQKNYPEDVVPLQDQQIQQQPKNFIPQTIEPKLLQNNSVYTEDLAPQQDQEIQPQPNSFMPETVDQEQFQLNNIQESDVTMNDYEELVPTEAEMIELQKLINAEAIAFCNEVDAAEAQERQAYNSQPQAQSYVDTNAQQGEVQAAHLPTRVGSDQQSSTAQFGKINMDMIPFALLQEVMAAGYAIPEGNDMLFDHRKAPAPMLIRVMPFIVHSSG